MSYFQKWVCSFNYKSWISRLGVSWGGQSSFSSKCRCLGCFHANFAGRDLTTSSLALWLTRLIRRCLVLLLEVHSFRKKVKSSHKFRGNLWQTWYIIQCAKIILIQICSRFKYVADLTTLYNWICTLHCWLLYLQYTPIVASVTWDNVRKFWRT